MPAAGDVTMEVWVVSEDTNTVRETARPDGHSNVAGVRLAVLFACLGSPVVMLGAAALIIANAPVRDWPAWVTAVISCLGSAVVVAAWLSLCWVRRIGAASYLGVPRSAEVLRGLQSRRAAIEAEARRRYGTQAAHLNRKSRRHAFAGRALMDGFGVSMFAYIGIPALNGAGASVYGYLILATVLAYGCEALIELENGRAARDAAAMALGVEIKTPRVLMQPRSWYLQWCEQQGIRPYPFDEVSGSHQPGI